MAGVSYSVPMNPHVAAAHATGVSILQGFSTSITMYYTGFLKTPCPPASGTIQLSWLSGIYRNFSDDIVKLNTKLFFDLNNKYNSVISIRM